MGTQKRERQKANRARRLEEQARAERADATKRTVIRVIGGGVLAVAAVVLIAWLGGAFGGDDEAAADTTVPTIATDAAVTLPAESISPSETTVPAPVPPKPEVAIPDEIPTELVITDLAEGTGEPAKAGDTVTVHYVGVRSADGTEFDNSYDRGTPFPVVLGTGGVIAGWDEGLVGAKAGGQRQLDIPAELAYGDQPRGDIIQANDALTFVVDIVSVEPAAG